jgi:hypothetical protein
MHEAARQLGVGDSALPPGIAVPGNHDVYIGHSMRHRVFEEAFAPWLHGERVSADDYPYARKVGHIWLIALNSAKPNFLLWDATGRVGDAQLARFRELCGRLDDSPRIVVSHYPILMENHEPEPRWHQLRDWAKVRDVAACCRARRTYRSPPSAPAVPRKRVGGATTTTPSTACD